MQQAPPQFSPDGLYWWDGGRWVPLAQPPRPVAPPLPPVYAGPTAPPWYTEPSPGLRIVLLIALSLEVGLSGLTSFVFFGSTIGGSQDNVFLGYLLGLAFAGLFVVSLAGIVGVATRAIWGRWMAIAAGILACWTIAGALLGVPILVTAARARDLARTPTS